MNSNLTPTFATLDWTPTADPVEGLGAQFTVEFRNPDGILIERIHGTRESCFAAAAQRNFLPSAVRITGRANR